MESGNETSGVLMRRGLSAPQTPTSIASVICELLLGEKRRVALSVSESHIALSDLVSAAMPERGNLSISRHRSQRRRS